MSTHEHYMQMALKLATKGLTAVEPNPAVGCVIVKDEQIIGQGHHEYFGGPHAEINALTDCRKNNADPTGSTAYVTLEPCCHTGKTGPCTVALIEAKIARVVAAVEDPFNKVAGKGFDQLRQAGIEVITGVCEKQARRINAPFFKFAKTARPWVIAKWAQSLDNKLAWNPPSTRRWISNDKSRLDAHRLRKRSQAILVGVDTVLIDNPELTVRIPYVTIDPQPLRVVLDTHLRMPQDCHLTNKQEAPTLIITTQSAVDSTPDKVAKFRDAGIDILTVGEAAGRCDLNEVLSQLGSRGIQQLLVEGGPTVLSSFFKERLIDEVCIYIAPLIIGSDSTTDLSAAITAGITPEKLIDVKIENFDSDIRISGLLKNLDE